MQRCRFSIPRTTWVYIVILGVIVVGAIMREINLLIILSGMMCGPLVISWQLISTTLRDLHVKRRMPSGVFPDVPFVVELHVKNRRRRLDSWALRIEDRIRCIQPGSRLPAESAVCLVPHLPAGELRVTSYRAHLAQRGRYRFGPLRLSTSLPVGLLKGMVSQKDTNEILVYPRVGQLTHHWSELVRQDHPGQQSWRRQHGPVEGDFYGLREWRAGDSRRWIHWRSSAKRQELVVRQFEQNRNQDVVILVDLSRPDTLSSIETAPTQAEQEPLEQLLSFAATVVSHQCSRAGGRLTVGVAGKHCRLLRGTASSALLNDVLEVMADANATDRSTLNQLIPDALAGTAVDDHVILLSLVPLPLHDSTVFPHLNQDHRRQSQLASAIAVAASEGALKHYFTLDTEATAVGRKEVSRS
jgi:uncharacterized protein (DUF58 family)